MGGEDGSCDGHGPIGDVGQRQLLNRFGFGGTRAPLYGKLYGEGFDY